MVVRQLTAYSRSFIVTLLFFVLIGLSSTSNGGGMLASAWSFGDTIPMSYQLRVNASANGLGEWTAMPLDFVPRFGLHRNVQLPSLDFLDSALHVSIRFRIDRGIDKMTKWITVKRAIPIDEDVAKRLSKHNSGKAPPKESHLNKITFKFGYQSGVFNRFTSLKVHAAHSEGSVPTIALHYDWDEHRRYNPHRALTVMYVISIVALLFLSHRILTKNILPVGKSGQSKRLVVVDSRTE